MEKSVNIHWLIKDSVSPSTEGSLVVVHVRSSGRGDDYIELGREPVLKCETVEIARDAIERFEVRKGTAPAQAYIKSHMAVQQYLDETTSTPEWMDDWWDQRNPNTL